MNKTLDTLAWTAVGLAATPLLEYGWHAWLGHDKQNGHESYDSHQEHHRTAHYRATPWDEMAKNAPMLAKTVAQACAAAIPFLGLRRATALSAGLLGGYVFTTLYHAQMHQRAPHTPYEEWMWRFHFHHHFKNANENFGLTNPLFDFLFGTAHVPDEVVIPEKMAPVWLHASRPGFTLKPTPSKSAA